MGIKLCPKCGISKEAKEFWGDKSKKDGLYSWCRDCCKHYKKGYNLLSKEKRMEYDRKWNKNNPGKKKAAHLKRKYNLTIEEYNQIFEEQNGQCLICNQIVKLGVDHNHVTNKVRGLLCGKCNKGIGIFNDNPLLLLNAIRYLEVYGN